MIKIRPAVAEDLLDLLVLSKEFMKENGNECVFSVEKVSVSLQQGILNPEWLIAVAEKDGEIVGYVGTLATSPLFSNDGIAIALAIFVSKDERGSSAGVRLMAASEKFAKEKNCRFSAIATTDPALNLDKLYERKGYKLTEEVFMKEI